MSIHINTVLLIITAQGVVKDALDGEWFGRSSCDFLIQRELNFWLLLEMIKIACKLFVYLLH
jgi:hypothetical protein